MKIVFSLLFCLSVSAIASAQQTATEKVADSCCACLEAQKANIKNDADFDRIGQGCMMKYVFANITELAKENNIDLEKLGEEEGNKLGQIVGTKLITRCPAFMEMIGQFTGKKEKPAAVPVEETAFESGRVAKVTPGEFLEITLNSDHGGTIVLTLLGYATGVEKYQANPANLTGKQFMFKYAIRKIYSVKRKRFITIREILVIAPPPPLPPGE